MIWVLFIDGPKEFDIDDMLGKWIIHNVITICVIYNILIKSNIIHFKCVILVLLIYAEYLYTCKFIDIQVKSVKTTLTSVIVLRVNSAMA